MKTGLCFILIAVLSLVLTNSAFAKEDRFPVSVNATADDIVGRRLVYKVKEEFRRSASMRLVDLDDAAVQLRLVTLPRDSDNPSLSTVYSAVWTLEDGDFYSFYVKSQVGYCGSDVLDSQAELLVAETDKAISDVMSMLKALWELQQDPASN